MVRIAMPSEDLLVQPSRRAVLAALAAAAVLPSAEATALPQPGRVQRSLRLQNMPIRLRQGQSLPETAAWRFSPDMGAGAWSFRRGDALELSLTNAIAPPLSLNCYGLDGVATAVPLLTQEPIAPGASATRSILLRAAGTYFFEARLGNNSAPRPLPCGAFVVNETAPPDVDRDEVLLLEDWRLKPDGTAIPPGVGAADTDTVYTINGRLDWTIAVRTNQRLRLRFINGCHRAAVAFRIADHEPRVIAIDGQPAEPFSARDGRLILSPGTRIDVLLDATAAPASRSAIWLHDGGPPRPVATLTYSADKPVREAMPPPLPALADNGLPARIPLEGAQRSELAIGVPPSDAEWVGADRISSKLAPAFHARRGRTVVLALTNRAAMPVTFHMHGHHFRLLDRLDDGWKPFWLDTLLFDAGQTQRIAFLAEHAGNWLIEMMGIAWASPRLTRWFAVD